MAKNPVSYKAPHPVYVDGQYFKPGEVFVTASEPGEKWEKIGKAEVAATEAEKKIPGDPPLESLGLEALRAVAVTKHVDPTTLDKKGLIAAIKAANEPHL